MSFCKIFPQRYNAHSFLIVFSLCACAYNAHNIAMKWRQIVIVNFPIFVPANKRGDGVCGCVTDNPGKIIAGSVLDRINGGGTWRRDPLSYPENPPAKCEKSSCCCCCAALQKKWRIKNGSNYIFVLLRIYAFYYYFIISFFFSLSLPSWYLILWTKYEIFFLRFVFKS